MQYSNEGTAFLHLYLPTAIFEAVILYLTGRFQLLAEEFMVIDEAYTLWQSCSSLLDIVLLFE
jgi:hypothetical protein